MTGSSHTSRAVAIGAICDRARGSGREDSQSFDVSEFIRLEDGEQVVLHTERGFTIGGTPQVLALVTEDHLVRSTLTTVLPDPDDGALHPWEWLLELANAKGVDLSLAEIKLLPYEVVLTPRTRSWLQSSQHQQTQGGSAQA